MKVKTNVRAGRQTQNRKSGDESEYTPPPAPISRCVGI